MLCDQCCNHILRGISSMQGNTVNCVDYGCNLHGCDYLLRKTFDDFKRQFFKNKRKNLLKDKNDEDKSACF